MSTLMARLTKPPKLDRWDDYFEPGEVLLWQGAPKPGIQSPWGTLFLSVFGVPFLAVGIGTAITGLGHLFGMDGGFDLGIGLFVTFFSIPFITAGAGMVFGSWIAAIHGHKFTRYALSNKRAYIARSFWKHSIDSYAILPDDVVTLEQGRHDTVTFKRIHEKDSDGDTRVRSIGFTGLDQGHEVYGLIRQIQKEALDADDPR